MKNARLDKYLGKKHAVIDFHPDPSSDKFRQLNVLTRYETWRFISSFYQNRLYRYYETDILYEYSYFKRVVGRMIVMKKAQIPNQESKT